MSKRVSSVILDYGWYLYDSSDSSFPNTFIIERPTVMRTLINKAFYTTQLAKLRFPVPLTAFFVGGDFDKVRLVSRDSIEDMSVEEAYAEFEKVCGLNGMVVSKPQSGTLGIGIKFYSLSEKIFKNALQPEMTGKHEGRRVFRNRMVQQFIGPPLNSEYMFEYRSIVVGGNYCGSYRVRSSRPFSAKSYFTNTAKGGIPEKVSEGKITEKLHNLSEQVVKSFEPQIIFSRVDALPNFYGEPLITEVNGFGTFTWKSYRKLFRNMSPINMLSDVIEDLSCGDVVLLHDKRKSLPIEYQHLKKILPERGIKTHVVGREEWTRSN